MSELVLEKRNELPRKWVGVFLGDVIIPIKGKKPKTLGNENSDLSIPYIDIKAFEKNEFTNFTIKTTCPKCSKDDVLIVWDGSRSGLVGSGVSGVIGSTLTKLFCFDINKKYLYYFLQMHYNTLNKNPKGIGIPHVNPEVLWSLDFPLPPLNEQKRIVKKIEELFLLCNKIKQLILETKIFHDSLVSSLYKFALSGSLTKSWRENNSPTSVSMTIKKIQFTRDENYKKLCTEASKNKQKKPRKPTCLDEKFNKILITRSNIPETWAFCTLNQLSSIQPRSIQSGPFGSTLLHKEFQKTGFLVIGIDNVHNDGFRFGSEHRISKEKFNELEKYQARPNDLLITVMGTIGRTCIVPNDIEPSIITKHVYRISLDEHLCYPDYVLLCMLGGKSVSSFFKKEQRGMTMPGLNGGIIKSTPIPLPPKEEQLLIIKIFKNILSYSQEIQNTIHMCEQKLSFFEKSILKQAFEGKLIPQDPNDESAEILLQKIKEEKKLLIQKQKASRRRKNVK